MPNPYSPPRNVDATDREINWGIVSMVLIAVVLAESYVVSVPVKYVFVHLTITTVVILVAAIIQDRAWRRLRD